MWRQIQAVLLLLFFLFFQFNSFYYTPPNRNYTKKEIEEMILQQREKNKPDYRSQEQENNNSQIEQEFPGDDVGVRYFEEESEDLKQTIFVENNTIIESDEEKIENQNDDLSEEYSYYYEYEYEIIYEEQFQEEIDSNETQILQNDQSTYPKEEVNSMLSQNQSLNLSNSTQIHFQTDYLITEQNVEGLPNDFEYQQITTENDKKIQENVNSSQIQLPQILLEEEWVEEEYYEEEIKDKEEIQPEQILINEDRSQQILQKNEASLSNQYNRQDFKQYFARICYIDENQQPIKQQPKLEEESQTNLWIHSFVLTLIAIYLHLKNRKTSRNKEEIQQQIIELNEYMTMMLERLEQQYYLIIKSQEQLTYQLELLEY